MPETVVQFDDVSKKFKRVHALRDLSFHVGVGEVFGFIGPNGCGKTTTIRTLLGFYKPDSGTVRVFGHDPLCDFASIGPSIGVMLDRPGLCDFITAAEYLEYYAGLLGIPRARALQERARTLQIVGLKDRAGDLLSGFSKGMRQRISLARCLLNRPRLLILDEPFDGIDVEARRDLTQILPDICRRDGTAVFVTSHNLPEIEKISHRVAVVKVGRIVGLDTPDALRHHAGEKSLIVITIADGTTGDELLRILPQASFDAERRELKVEVGSGSLTRDGVLKALVTNGVSISGLTAGTTLEDVYFSLTQAGAPQEGKAQ